MLLFERLLCFLNSDVDCMRSSWLFFLARLVSAQEPLCAKSPELFLSVCDWLFFHHLTEIGSAISVVSFVLQIASDEPS